MKKLNLNIAVMAVIVFLAGASRIFPHPPNFSPILAIALFGAAHFSKKWQAVFIPMLAVWLSDLFINNFVYSILAAYLAIFLRLTINNNFLISIIGSFLVGFLINKRLSYSIEKILFCGFFSCFTSFSGFIYFLYKILEQGDWIKFIIFFNLIIIVNLFTMFVGFWISRKIIT